MLVEDPLLRAGRCGFTACSLLRRLQGGSPVEQRAPLRVATEREQQLTRPHQHIPPVGIDCQGALVRRERPTRVLLALFDEAQHRVAVRRLAQRDTALELAPRAVDVASLQQLGPYGQARRGAVLADPAELIAAATSMIRPASTDIRPRAPGPNTTYGSVQMAVPVASVLPKYDGYPAQSPDARA